MQRQLTRLLFWLSDCCAWLLVVLGVVEAFTFALMPPALLFQHLPAPAILTPAYFSAAMLLVAKAARMLTEREPLGLLLMQIVGLRFAWLGQYTIAALWLGGTLLLFGLPLLLVWQEVRRRAAALTP